MYWGKGTTNNSIGWGKGADNNSIGWGSVYPVSSSGDTDIQSGLANTVAPAISGTNEVGETLTCTTGTWSGGNPITYAYQWKRDGVSIGAATNSTYVLISADAETDITCTVTATNSEGSNSATSNTITIAADVDPDAQAFITAASITDPTQQSAVNQLVLDLKSASIWTKMRAVYPMVGSSSSQMKWNLKDPRDLDIAFRLSFQGGWSFSANGALPNGVNAYANTFLNPNTYLSLNSSHLCYYSRTNISSTQVDMGINGSNDSLYLLYSYSGTGFKAINEGQHSGGSAFSPTNGLLIGSRTASNVVKYYHKGSLIDNLATNSGALSGQSVFIGAYSNTGIAQAFSSKECAFASIGDGLSDTEAANLYTAVQTFQTTLSRNV